MFHALARGRLGEFAEASAKPLLQWKFGTTDRNSDGPRSIPAGGSVREAILEIDGTTKTRTGECALRDGSRQDYEGLRGRPEAEPIAPTTSSRSGDHLAEVGTAARPTSPRASSPVAFSALELSLMSTPARNTTAPTTTIAADQG